MPTNVCTAKASYKKAPGTLELTDTHLQWSQDGKKVPSVRVPYHEATSLFCSKEGAAQVRLKLGLVNDDNGHNFTFTAPQAVAYSERETFKRELTNIISRNRSTVDSIANPAAAPPPIVAASSASPSKAPTPRPPVAVASASRASTSRAPSVSSDRRTPILPGTDAASDFRLRKKVLMGNPELASLHRELVMSGQITEAEFWEGREHLLLAESATESQRKGRPGQLVDPRPQTVEGGEIKIVITPQLVHDIFEEFPVVAKAYNDNVPNKLSEADFWKRYFQSKLFNAHRASIRSSAAQHVVKEDPIFDKYLEKDDDELEPRRARDEVSDLFINLGATLEDHGETGNERDITMQPGRQRGALPLIRKFNEHSERLLNSALGDKPPAKRRRVNGNDGGNDAYGQLDLDDLHDPETSVGIILEMQDRQRYFEGQMASAAAVEDARKKAFDVRPIFKEARDSLVSWEYNLNQLKLERKPGDAALLSMTQNVASRLDVKSKKNEMPPDLFIQLTTCQTAANEFLRQFWSAIYPPSTETQTIAPATPAQKATKAAKMAGYLGKTHEKVDALVRTAQVEGVDSIRVQVAMKPILDAVDHALAFYHTRSAKPTKGIN
ncbi:hypothetical protein SERLADRAFT_465142 [Serpula lacrymans var. lacrymans S7.9]|uniref:BSD domain-containing protein n=1 Tax=Serpula lacrymans var. lacrymans (strain S7.9) TaxID=578457 RepID=F8NUU6_SERL9|nr:uncharacterized protein SERLADRAFT_465142 [Serpula lacrymans var. lacrymans S7.9]EGO25262.1 hypothetical protein SERLADRAFT_465142 [Serpula lacrymans var. lacrymans S7.9]